MECAPVRPRALAGEFIGTAFLLAGVVGSGIMAERLSDDVGVVPVVFMLVRSGRTRLVAGAVAAYIGAAYWFTASTSFANPAVTVARTLSDTFAGIEPASAPMFVAMQIVGAALAAATVRLLYPPARS